MAKKKGRTRRRKARRQRTKALAAAARKGKHGAKAKAIKKVRAMTVKGGKDIWALQDALRKDGYFARAVGPKKIATNAPIKSV